MSGSLRQRGPDSWELRVYRGVDADTGRERWANKTVHGSRRHATAQLHEFVEEAGYARLRAGTVADLLERWLTNASPGWSTSTLRQNRSVIECHLKPLLGHLAVNKLTTVDIDDVYRHLLRAGGAEGRPLAAGTVHRVHGSLRARVMWPPVQDRVPESAGRKRGTKARLLVGIGSEPGKKRAAKSAAKKKSAARKSAAKKSTGRKSTAKRKSAAKKSTARKSTAKRKSAAKKSTARKSAAKRSARRS